MKRELPLLSPISIMVALLIIIAVGYSMWKNGGLGFSPGQVSAKARQGVHLQQFSSHADFEQDCARCHQPQAADQTSLCLDCHKNIAEQRMAKTGTHGSINQATRCAACHPEHKGRDYDPVAFAVTQFDHTQTRLPLTGAHAKLECSNCHKDGNYQLSYQGCSGCHSEPALHAGMFDLNCEQCHTDLYWQPAMMAGKPFDHEQTRFSLKRHAQLSTGQAFNCSDCHNSTGGKANLQACAACHAKIDQAAVDTHLKTMGPDCLQCHDGTDRMTGFDHNTRFPLDGQHSQLDCAACHKDFHFSDTSTNCSACHQEPEIHAGFFGAQCQYCHTTQAWTPAKLTRHTFALDHGSQGDLTCQTCHPASYQAFTCYTCHDHTLEGTTKQHQSLNLPADALAQCARCHPTGKAGEAKNLTTQGGAQ